MTNTNIPKHIAIIPDGNRRWAKEKGLAASLGHKKASEAEKLKKLYLAAKKLKVECITLWGFSTENWKRSETEKKFLFDLFTKLIDSLSSELLEDQIRFIHIGRRDRLPKELMSKISTLENQTSSFTEFTLCLALDYGGRDEIVRATNKLLAAGNQVTEESLTSVLDTKDLPDLDLIIRTSGEQRLSGFMPYQSVYAELLFIDKYFPDFSVEDLENAINNFGSRARRFGK
ncbi:di-trans,poly-cis-decaprenylcistransferase [archaeon]|jgi:undecaprenyl diphosphate synthase|nr:di-trans,poly-cis-decaprenylcistransferase [archaeon]MBT6762687.1 di-trans,poly-cis-decaprenylcistransferase [archaeon]